MIGIVITLVAIIGFQSAFIAAQSVWIVKLIQVKDRECALERERAALAERRLIEMKEQVAKSSRLIFGKILRFGISCAVAAVSLASHGTIALPSAIRALAAGAASKDVIAS